MKMMAKIFEALVRGPKSPKPMVDAERGRQI